MPTSSDHFPLPLDLLIGRLEAAGFRVDTSRRLRVLRVFDDLGNPFVGGHFEELKYLLSPLVSRSPQEQERFYEIFDAFWRECEEEARQVEAAGVFAEGEKVADEVRVLAKLKKRWRWWWVAAGAVVATVTAMMLWTMAHQSMVRLPGVLPFVVEGDTLRVGDTMYITPHSILGIPLPTIRPKASFHWEIRDSAMQVTLHRDTGDLAWRVSEKAGRSISIMQKVVATTWLREVVHYDTLRVGIECSNPPEASEILAAEPPPYQSGKEYEFSIQTEPGCLVSWDYFGGDGDIPTLPTNATGINTFRLRVGELGTTGLQVIVSRPGDPIGCSTSRGIDIPVGNGGPILPLTPFQRAESFSVFTISRLGWLLIALPLLLAGWFFYRWRKKRNTPAPQKTPEELADQYPVVDAGPYFIPYRSQEHSITVPREFFRIAEVLRRREEGQRRYFDGPATVRATIESGGFPAWRERAVTRPSEYLFLVERPDERDQQGKLFTRLCDFLKRRDVPLVTFFHDGSFQHFWNPEYADGLPPLELRRRYPHHRLVLLGATHGLVNPYATRQPELLRGPLDWMLHWQRRLLLTPEPVAAWSFQEALLHRHFLVFPADTEGILSGIDLLDRTEEYHAGRFERWQDTRAPRHSPETHRYRTWKTAADHADYLSHDPDCFRWLCALAVCAQPDWSLTLAIGRAIGVEVTHDRLLLLTRIPWLSQNLPNDGLRLDLLRQLSPADEQAARQTVAQELEAVRSATANSFADTERTANAAVQNFALDPRDEAHKQAIRELRTLGLLSGSQEAELDFIVQEKADPSGLPNSASEGIEGWLDVPAPKKFWTWEMGLGLVSLALSAALLLALSLREKPFPAPFDGLMKEVVQSSELMELNERAIAIAERVLAEEDYQAWLGLQDSVRVADSLFQEVANEGMISVNGGFTKIAQHKNTLGINLPIFRYNVAAKNFNFHLTDDVGGDQVLYQSLRSFEWVVNVARKASPPIKLAVDAEHGQGLCHYYEVEHLDNHTFFPRSETFSQLEDAILRQQKAKLDSARLVYESISRNLLYPNYFDSIQATMPVNLKTLLEAEKALNKPAETKPTDRDGDGVPDEKDNCPDEKGVAENGGCPAEELESAELIHTLANKDTPYRVAFSPNGKRLATTANNTAKIWDLESGKALIKLEGHREGVFSVAISPDGKRLATVSDDRTAKIWDLESGKETMTLSGHTAAVLSVAFSPDGKRLATGSSDGTAKIWDLESGKALTTLDHSTQVRGVAFSPNGKRLATGGNRTIKIWDLESGKALTEIKSDDMILSVAISPDGKRLATGSSDKTVKIWDLESGKETMTLSGHTDVSGSVAFSPDGKRLATGSHDRTAKIWDLESGKALTTVKGHSDAVWSVAFSPDGKRLATGSEDNTVKIWRLGPQKGSSKKTKQ